MISKSLMASVESVNVIHGCKFSPHAPVALDVRFAKKVRLTKRLAMPRLLPIEKPIGPQLPARVVDWARWNPNGTTDVDDDGNLIDSDDRNPAEKVQVAAMEWAAGIEVELLGIFGLHDQRDAAPYMGIGLPRKL